MSLRAYCDESGCPESAPMSIDDVAPLGWTVRYAVVRGRRVREPRHVCPACMADERRATRVRARR